MKRTDARSARTLIAAAAVLPLVVAGCSAGGTGGEGDTVVLDFAWWGDTTRAERYEEAVALFEEQNPGVEVRTNFAAWGDYWSARNTEAASGSLPDVIQMDVAYLAEYGTAGRVAPLDEHIGAEIDTSALPEGLVESTQLDGQTYAIPTSTNTLATIVNTDLLADLGVEAPEGDLTWDEYDAFLADVAQAGAGQDPVVHGSVDYTQILWLFQIWLGQQGKTLFADGSLGFTEEDLAQWWGRAAPLHEDGTFLPAERLDQLEGVDAMGVLETASEISWDNFLVRFSEGADGANLTMLPPPADDPEQRGLFLKPSLMLSMAAGSEHPEEAAALIDFITNDPQVGEIFGISRGVPASSTALEGFEPEGLDAQVVDYEAGLEPYLTSAAPPPVAGFGTVEAAFVRIDGDLAHGALTLDEAVEQFFAEAESALAG
ncbi:carbohydrate ABC transporter substrate-binding protein (CUT1 family) [Promicromonospora sp. AC04]|uniref:ABC transporter substrate-binding protein n=1 Tax=Promicromonospora sp. AC04 TaxID=2135723 RepID=UPI000D4CC4F6|nr:ABC transporter substrate-binding protein [Promicromonospora sp. AC04]PUB24116.1 carbohydrate ABC transporter substrate-binding protein (CUT1 family) [Promicromonospora sp. AC04]